MQEVRSLLLSPALWLMFTVLSLLVGYSFIQAVDLYSKASHSALAYPELARGMNPQEGIFIPTFGAYYLVETLLLPFVAIRLVGLDKQSGALKLLLQLDFPPLILLLLKGLAMGLVWLPALLPGALMFLVWHKLGGHIHLPEAVSLLAGHGLYVLVVVTLGMFCGAVTGSQPTAAMLCLSFTLGSWILDFAAGSGGLPATLADHLSLAAMLRHLENGLITTSHLATFLGLGSLFFFLAVIWLHPGRKSVYQVAASLLLSIVLGSTLFLCHQAPGSLDVTEQHNHSFNPADARTLSKLDHPLTITLHLDREDSRLQDLERGLLARLRRTVPDLQIRYARTSSTGLFAAGGDDNYGLIEYAYNGLSDQSYSNSEKEILAIIYGLAGMEVKADPVAPYPGYPLVADGGTAGLWLYFLLPLFYGCTGILCRKRL